MAKKQLKNTISEREKSGELFPEKSNKILLRGILQEDFILSRFAWGKKFYKSTLIVDRLSDNKDFVPIIASGNCNRRFYKGDEVEIKGYIDSEHYTGTDGKRHMKVFVVATEIINAEGEHLNEVFLHGFIPPKTPTLRETPSGRTISDINIITNMSEGKVAYVPCIAWEDNAVMASNLKKGNEVIAHGRFQSRKYLKKIEGYEELRTTYEISIFEFDWIR